MQKFLSNSLTTQNGLFRGLCIVIVTSLPIRLWCDIGRNEIHDVWDYMVQPPDPSFPRVDRYSAGCELGESPLINLGIHMDLADKYVEKGCG